MQTLAIIFPHATESYSKTRRIHQNGKIQFAISNTKRKLPTMRLSLNPTLTLTPILQSQSAISSNQTQLPQQNLNLTQNQPAIQ